MSCTAPGSARIGVECSLLDARNWIVRKYSAVRWDHEVVVRNLELPGSGS